MEIMRLVVTGPVGAGKSTFIRSVSEIAVVDTDRRATDETSQLKPKTTVALDLGRLQFGPDMAVHIYGTPGQFRFDFMWDILIRKAHAYIMLVPANRPAEFRNARRINSFMQQRSSVPMLIGMTHVDCEDAWAIENVAIALGYLDLSKAPPIITVNAQDSASAGQALMALVKQIMKTHLNATKR